MARLLAARPANSGAGLTVDAELADSLGIGHIPDRTYLAGKNTPIDVAATYAHPDDGRGSTLSGAALAIVVDNEPFDSCWVRFWPPTDNPLELMGPVTNGSQAGGSGDLIQWNPTFGRSYDPAGEFRRLPLAGVAAAAAAIAALLAYAGVRLRRLELASARHVGMTQSSLVGIAVAEISLWLAPACVLALTALAFAATWGNPDPPDAAWAAGARTVAAAAAAWILTAGITTATIRETRLVRYFQQR
ncbi:hypothetical protein FJ693_13780 [Georgenia yuyongxinii]|uniref:FtsX-like permease family protein n=2 Tax=Georgenia yuyongxinii TaxID=2589797 RepID=A0A552WNN5_9MICO|nr:hypothetical protein FJ693_13780 [Georgenia yuyongxinii]